MPLPTTVQTTDSFNTWLDATNNLISHVANTNAYVLVTNASSANLVATGNVYINGTVHQTTLVANANVVLGGTSLNQLTPIFKLTTNSANVNTISLYGTNLAIVMTNTVWSGTDLAVGPNTVFQGSVIFSSSTTLTKNVSLATVMSITTNSTVNTLTVGSNEGITFNVNSSVSQITTNSTVYTTNAANIFFTGTNLTVGANAVTNGTLTTNNTTTFNGNVVFNANATFVNQVILGGPLAFGSAFVETATNLSGTGIASPLTATANATIHRITATDPSLGYSGKVIAGIQQANTAQYRQLVLFNTGTTTLIFQHANTAAGANGVLCPGSTEFQIPAGGTSMLYYDASIVGSGARWRVVSAPIGSDASTTTTGYVNTSAQSFAGAKTFTGAVSASSTLAVNGAVTLSNTLSVANNTTLSGTLGVTRTVTLSNTLAVTGSSTLSNTLSVSGAVNALSTLGVSGAVNVLSTLGVSGAVNALSTLGVSGAVNALSTLGVAGALTALNTLSVSGAVNALSTLGVSGTLAALGQMTVAANVNIDSGTLFVDAVNNRVGLVNTTPGHTLRVDGTTSLNGAVNALSTLSVSGAVNALGTLGVSGAATFSQRPTFNGQVPLDAANYNSYSPTLTGGGATGTWGINITGNAGNITAYSINQNLSNTSSVEFSVVRCAYVYQNGMDMYPGTSTPTLGTAGPSGAPSGWVKFKINGYDAAIPVWVV